MQKIITSIFKNVEISFLSKYNISLEANIHGINVYSLHPGFIPTKILRHGDSTLFSGSYYLFNLFTRIFCKNIVQGAQTTIYCSVDDKTANETGLYYS